MKLVLDGVRLPLAHFALEVTCTMTARVTGLFGPSGSGKTSLLDVIAGLRRAEGRIALDGRSLEDLPPHQRGVGYVPQENALFPHMTVARNIRYGAGERPIDHVVEVLEIGHLLRRGVTALSGGEQKRVALARALVVEPRLLLLDEPLAGLDHPLRSRIMEFLLRIRDDFAVPMLYVTHEADELARIAEEVVVIREGRVVDQRTGGQAEAWL
jgi:molybdate transport system ATP-binding protein